MNMDPESYKSDKPNEILTAYVTKYWMTAGIIVIPEAEVCSDTSGNMIKGCFPGSSFFNSYFHGEGREWHRTVEGAVARANTLRDKKIAALKKQIGRLTARHFTVDNLKGKAPK